MRLHKTDIELLTEAYEQVNEGLFDRLKARGSQAIGAVKGAGQQIAGKAQQAAGSLTSKAGDLVVKGVEAVGGTVDPSKNKLSRAGSSMQKAGGKQVNAGQRAGDEAKYKSYIDSSAKTIATDLSKLGMVVSDEAALIQDLQATIIKHLKNVTKSGQFRDTKGRIGGKVA